MNFKKRIIRCVSVSISPSMHYYPPCKSTLNQDLKVGKCKPSLKLQIGRPFWNIKTLRLQNHVVVECGYRHIVAFKWVMAIHSHISLYLFQQFFWGSFWSNGKNTVIVNIIRELTYIYSL